MAEHGSDQQGDRSDERPQPPDHRDPSSTKNTTQNKALEVDRVMRSTKTTARIFLIVCGVPTIMLLVALDYSPRFWGGTGMALLATLIVFTLSNSRRASTILERTQDADQAERIMANLTESRLAVTRMMKVMIPASAILFVFLVLFKPGTDVLSITGLVLLGVIVFTWLTK